MHPDPGFSSTAATSQDNMPDERTPSTGRLEPVYPRIHRARQDEIVNLRNELVGLLTGDNSALSPAGSHTASKLTALEKVAVESGTRAQLRRYPSALRDAWEIASLETTQQSRLNEFNASQDSETITMNDLALSRRDGASYARRRSHRGSDDDKKLQKCSVSVQLMPFLNKTIQLLWISDSGGSGWRIAPKIRVRGTVRRKSSPLFHLFDEFALSHYTDKNTYFHGPPPGPWDRRTHAITSADDTAVFTWNIPSTARELERMASCIKKLVETGAASVTDTDEHGNTVLHEICNLLLLLEQKHPSDWHYLDLENALSAQLEALIALTLHYGVDPFQPAAEPHRRPVRVRHLGSDVGPVAAFGYYYAVKANIPWFPDRFSSQEDAPGVLVTKAAVAYDLSDAVGSLNLLKPDMWRPGETRGPRKLHILRNHPEVAEGLGYDDLAMAIIQRSHERLVLLARRQGIVEAEVIDIPQHADHFDYLTLALGWEEGLRSLTVLGYEPTLAIVHAIEHDDDASLAILLDTEHALFGPKHVQILGWNDVPTTEKFSHGWPFECMFNSSKCWALLVQELRRRRDALKDLAISFFTPDECNEFGLSAESVLDSNATEVGELLASKTSVPPSLDCYRMAPIYDRSWSWDSSDTLGRLNALLDAGFAFTEIPDEDEQTQLSKFSRDLFSGSELIFGKADCVRNITWFLQHGANPLFAPYVEEIDDSDDSEEVEPEPILQYPTVLFTIAALASQDFEPYFPYEKIPPEDFEEAMKRCGIVLKMTNVDYGIRDACHCLCSTSGCLPVNLLSPCGHINSRDMGCSARNQQGKLKPASRVRSLEQLLSLLPLSNPDRELWQEAGVRLEIFERLGMAHTCCTGMRHQMDYAPRKPPSSTLTDKELCRIREEDAEFAVALDSLMQQYRSLRTEWQEKGAHRPGSEDSQENGLWGRWWNTVDEILPPMTREEACRTHLWEAAEIEYEPSEYDEAKRRIATERADKEREAMVRGGYGGWGFREVIQRHFQQEKRRHLADSA